MKLSFSQKLWLPLILSLQSKGIGQVNDAVPQMDTVTQQNAALVEEVSAAAFSMKAQADDLRAKVARFRLA